MLQKSKNIFISCSTVDSPIDDGRRLFWRVQSPKSQQLSSVLIIKYVHWSVAKVCETFHFRTSLFILSFSISLQFNISIQDLPEVFAETKKELQLSQTDANITSRLPLCVEISLQTVDNDRMILEVWSLNVNTDLGDPQIKANYTVYNRMSIILKSLLSITRVTPAYKLSRRQSPESYCIYYKIYSGETTINLGELSYFFLRNSHWNVNHQRICIWSSSTRVI